MSKHSHFILLVPLRPSSNALWSFQMEKIVEQMQQEETGVPVRTVKSFMTKIPSVFTGADLITWMMRNLDVEDQTAEALHLAHLMAAHGYFFPIDDHVLTVKKTTLLSTGSRLPISGLPTVGNLKTQTMLFTCAKGRCKTRRDSNWPTTRPRTWRGYRRCSAGNGSSSSCRLRRRAKWTRRGTSWRGRSWTLRNGPSGTSIGQ
ncbi:hypothetical protein C7M84_002290, partial [Penaeus vannamei]